MTKAVYIHIPFCKSLCSYCDFCKMFYINKWVDLYLDCLEDEIKNMYENEKITSLYIGGGTPSSLTVNQLEKLNQIIKLLYPYLNSKTILHHLQLIRLLLPETWYLLQQTGSP